MAQELKSNASNNPQTKAHRKDNLKKDYIGDIEHH
jgi:hypothetical protein